MSDGLLFNPCPDAIPLHLVLESESSTWLAQQEASLRAWLTAVGFKMKPGSFNLKPTAEGQKEAVIICIKNAEDIWALAGLPAALPEGHYFLDASLSPPQLERLTVGWALGAYQFSRYKTPKRAMATLAVNPACNANRIRCSVEAMTLVRDLINTPAEDMMPEHFAAVMQLVSQAFGARMEQIVGDDLLTHHYPMIHTVGRASTHLPRLLDLRWGNPNHPKVTLVGKGVCFDTGGLDLKPSSAMRLMKKDMGGAATALGLGQLIMSLNLPVSLRVLIPAVDNAVSGQAFRPGDIIRSRQGLSVEIHNTDAEGRLILCDALTEASSEQPEVLFDFATLTGAARVALGTEIPALFCNNEDLATSLLAAAEREQDPFWRLPLHHAYRDMLDSKIADLANATESSYAGAITAALFLQEFVPDNVPWAHFDLMAWNLRTQPGRPEGGEAMVLRAIFGWLEQRYSGEQAVKVT